MYANAAWLIYQFKDADQNAGPLLGDLPMILPFFFRFMKVGLGGNTIKTISVYSLNIWIGAKSIMILLLYCKFQLERH